MATFTLYNNQPDTLASKLLSTPSGISIVGQSATYKGSIGAASSFDQVAFGPAVLHRGILLTTGFGKPAQKNTVSNFTVQNNTPGDDDLGAIIQNAFSTAGVTADASVLEFKINVDPGVKTVVFEVIFGSDEFPEWSNTKFVDIAAIMVNGKNAAFFGGDTKKPLSVLDANKDYFQDNTTKGLPIEYDGISNKLTVVAPVHEGVNTIKIAIADTGDVSLDSGIFVSNMRGSSKDLAGIFNEVTGTELKDVLKALPGVDNYVVGGLGPDKLIANTGHDILWGDLDIDEASAVTKVAAGDIAAGLSDSFKDTFVFNKLAFLEKSISKTDVIADWDKKDKIDLSKMDKGKFDFIGTHKFSGDGDPEVRFKKFKSKDYTAVYIDKDGDGKTDATIKLLGVHNLNDDDFVV